MADKKISQLTGATTPLAGTEVLPIVQSGSTVKVAVSDLTAGRSISASGVTISGGTVNGVVYLNASKAATSGTGLVFDGTDLGVGTSDMYGRLNVQKDTSAPNSTISLGDFADATQSVGIYGRVATPGAFTISSAGAPINFSLNAGSASVGGWDASGNYKIENGNLIVGTADKGIANSGDTSSVKFLTTNGVYFSTASTERGRFTAGGYFKASDAGTYEGGGSSYHELRSSTSDEFLARFTHTAASLPYGVFIKYTAATPNDTASSFLVCNDSTANRATIRSNGGLANYQSNNVDLSDARTKKEVNPAPSYWNKIAALEIVTYKYNDQTHDDVNVGVIAQQVESVDPVWVDPDGFGETPEDGVPLKTVYTKDITFAAIKALQEAMARIEALEAEVAALKAK